MFFPAGIQLSAFLFAESTTDFNRLEGKMEQEIVIYLQFSSFCPFIWKNILQEKACRVHKFQQTHDGLLQSYQNRGKRNCCVTIPEKFEHLEMFYFTFHSLILLPVCPFPIHLDKKPPTNYHNMNTHQTSQNPKCSNDPLLRISLTFVQTHV